MAGGGDTLLNMSDTDLQLLARYTRHRAEDAFAELVRRHLDLVHSAALRQVRSPQLAEEVAQTVFTDLARQAPRLAADTIVAAWLYEVTRRTAIDVVRRESRRQLREQIATEMNAMNATADDWSHIEPLLDEAMHALDATDRAAVLLRYFENKSLREVGVALGTSDDAAQKRVSRAVERLREFFAKRGLSLGASGLAFVLSAKAVHAAPMGLELKVSMVVRGSGSLDSKVANGLGQMLSARTGILVICVAACVGVPFLIQRLSDARSRREVTTPNEQFSGQFVQADFFGVNTAPDLEYGSPEYWKALHRMAAGKTKDAFILSSALTQYVSKQSGMFPTNLIRLFLTCRSCPP